MSAVEVPTPMTTLSRGTDHLGFIEATLRDLKGYGTLANELIQNADDATGATRVLFDIRDDALIVENDGFFRDCGQQELPECPWFVDRDTDSRCDFHSFRDVASGDKRNREGTTGAFGIGFIAVYQVTDHPEVISAGRHWIVQDDRPESERIGVCPGCDRDGVPGTRFVLPWARDPSSSLRRRLRAPVVTDPTIDAIEAEVASAIVTGILFLRKVEAIEVRRNGSTIRRVDRLMADDRILVNDGVDEWEWLLVRGDFAAEANRIRGANPGKIETKRSSVVSLAVPVGFEAPGVLAQGLPTQQATGLPFLINADFFPSSDRKKMIFESDYQGDWNRAAVQGAADTVMASLISLRDALGPTGVWRVIDAIRSVAASGASRPDDVFSAFWDRLLPALAAEAIGYGIDERWHRLGEILRPVQDEEAAAAPLLASLGVILLHPDLRPYTFTLPGQAGLRSLALGDMATALRAAGLTGVVSEEAIPTELRADGALHALWGAIEELLDQKRSSAEARAAFLDCAVVPTTDGGLAGAGVALVADPPTAALFVALVRVPFVDVVELESAAPRLLAMCAPFDPERAIRAIEDVPPAVLRASCADGRLVPRSLIGWFAARQDLVLGSTALKARLAALPIYPRRAGLAPLDELAMVGDFKDPLDLTEFVDLEALHGLKAFLGDLGVETLDLRTYVLRLPRLADDLGDALEPRHRRQILRLLADRLGEFRDDRQVHEAARTLALADVGSGFVRADKAYLDTAAVRETLSRQAMYVRLAEEHAEADWAVLEWLGTRATPRRADLRTRIERLTAAAPTDGSVQAVARILSYIGRQSEGRDLWDGLADLKGMAWLPAEGDREGWYRPSEVYAGYSKSLFSTQADFLDVPMTVQRAIPEYLDWLGVEDQPAVGQVVDHLMHLIAEVLPVGKDVYLHLNNKAAEPEVQRLRGTSCLKFGDEAFRPDQVFWEELGLAPYAHCLGPELRQYGALLSALGVKELPDHADAIGVLRELAGDVGHRILTEEQVALAHACWRLIERDREDGRLDPAMLGSLHDQASIPSAAGVLERPDWLFFEDRPGLASRFGLLLKGVVIERVAGAWRSMREAGVRDLGRVVDLRVIERSDPREDPEVSERIMERKELLLRVIEVHARTAAETHGEVLEDLRALMVDDLVIQYTVPLGPSGRRADSEAGPTTATYLRDEQSLYSVRVDGAPEWSAIAREIAVAVFPSLEPGVAASGFSQVLSAATHAAAEAVLDVLDYPRLAQGPTPREGRIDLGALGDDVEPEPADDDVGTGDGYEPEEPPGDKNDGEDGSATSMVSAGPAQPSEQAAERRPPVERKKTRHQQSRLRSYVVPGGNESGEEDLGRDRGEDDRDTALGDVGVRRVVEVECAAGWTPEVMPPGNPGFDIRSISPRGEERLIEVKATAVEWDVQGVGVSRPQFMRSLEEAERFWLYVVEWADDDERARVFRIQDPGRRVNQYLFDGGWRTAAAEPDGIAAAPLHGEAEDGVAPMIGQHEASVPVGPSP